MADKVLIIIFGYFILLTVTKLKIYQCWENLIKKRNSKYSSDGLTRSIVKVISKRWWEKMNRDDTNHPNHIYFEGIMALFVASLGVFYLIYLTIDLIQK